MTRKQLMHLIQWLAAMYVSEQWTPLAESGGKRGLYAKARRVVVFDRTLNQVFAS